MGMEYSSAVERAADCRTRLPLDAPDQFALSWTTLGDLQENATKHWLKDFAASLSSADEATRQFWPAIAKYGLVFNFIILQRVSPDEPHLKSQHGSAWTPRMDAVWQAGNLYVIDMTFFAQFDSNVVNCAPRFTPGTRTMLERDPVTRAINPFSIQVSDCAERAYCTVGDPAWLYALQAAKTSITVWGIWIGHVYHWHIVTAAMQMTMFQNLDAQHPVSQLFGRQSDYLIAFNELLLLDWAISPPTSVTTSTQFLQMMNASRRGGIFSMTIPLDTSAGWDCARRTWRNDWADYPVVRHLLALLRRPTLCDSVVNAFYRDDAAVASDSALQGWISASGDPGGGNVRGLPEMTTRAALIKVLTSLVYRVTAHGCGRLNQTANPVLSLRGEFSAVPAGRNNSAGEYAICLQGRTGLARRCGEPCALPALYRHDRRDDHVPVHLHLFAALYPVHSTRRDRRGASVHRPSGVPRRCATPRWSSTAPISKPSSASTPPTTASRARRRKFINIH